MVRLHLGWLHFQVFRRWRAMVFDLSLESDLKQYVNAFTCALEKFGRKTSDHRTIKAVDLIRRGVIEVTGNTKRDLLTATIAEI